MTYKSQTGSAKRVRCPECGDQFRPRGLAAHRRHKHGVGKLAGLMSVASEEAPPAKSDQPSRVRSVKTRTRNEPSPTVAPAPTEPPVSAEPTVSAEPPVSAEDRVARLEARLEERLDRIESLVMAGLTMPQPARPEPRPREEPRPVPLPEPPASDLEALQIDLDQILERIHSEKAALDEAEVGSGARSEAKKTLGLLRRRQFAILFRMGSQAPGVTLDADGLAFGF